MAVAEVEAEPRALDQHLCQCGNVAITEVDPLAGDRVNAVRGVADQRQPIGCDLRGVMETERIG